MKNFMKKLSCFVLSFIMVLAVSGISFAAEKDNEFRAILVTEGEGLSLVEDNSPRPYSLVATTGLKVKTITVYPLVLDPSDGKTYYLDFSKVYSTSNSDTSFMSASIDNVYFKSVKEKLLSITTN